MYRHLQGIMSYLDMLAEGGRRHVELIAGRDFAPEPGLMPVVIPASRKFPLTGHQKSRLFETRRAPRVSTRN